MEIITPRYEVKFIRPELMFELIPPPPPTKAEIAREAAMKIGKYIGMAALVAAGFAFNPQAFIMGFVIAFGIFMGTYLGSR